MNYLLAGWLSWKRKKEIKKTKLKLTQAWTNITKDPTKSAGHKFFYPKHGSVYILNCLSKFFLNILKII